MCVWPQWCSCVERTVSECTDAAVVSACKQTPGKCVYESMLRRV